ncbi:MAG: hypothetical protein LBD23_01305 [Oscillospiraceae bacterium]|jgi:shikimate kinase|nr:hypothetical protein [Oscillospiraceae bacterium]
MNYIILIGPKHSGKTSTGKALASLISCEFIDLDELIFHLTSKTPRQLLSECPETFKKAETESCQSIYNKITNSQENTSCVIAAGGGIIDNHNAITTIKKLGGKLVYLDISAACAWERISNSLQFDLLNGELPAFLQLEKPDPTTFKLSIEEIHRFLHERRAAAYRQIANVIISVGCKSPNQIATETRNSIEKPA